VTSWRSCQRRASTRTGSSSLRRCVCEFQRLARAPDCEHARSPARRRVSYTHPAPGPVCFARVGLMPKRRNNRDREDNDDRVQAPELQAVVALPNGATGRRCRWWRRRGPRAGTQCAKPAMRGAFTCKTHGGGNAKRLGPANPNWKGGKTGIDRWLKRLPPLAAAAYAEGLDDPERLELRREILLVDVKIGEELDCLRDAEDWTEVRSAFTALTGGMTSGNAGDIRANLERLRVVVTDNVKNDRTWARILKLIERRRRLVESERRRMAQNAIPREQALALANALLEACVRHVDDRATLLRIRDAFRLITEDKPAPETEDLDVVH
jgi:hypothetical protein